MPCMFLNGAHFRLLDCLINAYSLLLALCVVLWNMREHYRNNLL